jgi:cytochrome c biogenesis protein CcmG, thiol:disulfide interchange protein DsbE
LSRRIILGVLLVAIVLVIVLSIHRKDGNTRRESHPSAPDFSLSQLNGQSLQLASYRGKVVLLDFWATWCDPCRDEIPHLIELQNKYRAQGLQIIGVSMDDSPDPVRDFSQHFKMNYPVVMGNADIGRLYGGVLGLPIAFLIDREGRIQKKFIGATSASVFEQNFQSLLKSGT